MTKKKHIKYQEETATVFISGQIQYRIKQIAENKFIPLIQIEASEIKNLIPMNYVNGKELERIHPFMIEWCEELDILSLNYNLHMFKRSVPSDYKYFIWASSKNNRKPYNIPFKVPITLSVYGLPGIGKILQNKLLKRLKEFNEEFNDIERQKLSSQQKVLVKSLQQQTNKYKQKKFLEQVIQQPHTVDQVVEIANTIEGTSDINKILKSIE